VNVLLDTCAVLALAQGTLPAEATSALKTASEAAVSVVSSWEVAIKTQSGKLRLSSPPLTWFLDLAERYDLRELQLDLRTVCAAAELPPLHRDPFDRVLVAIAHARTSAILTSDRDIARYPGIQTIW